MFSYFIEIVLLARDANGFLRTLSSKCLNKHTYFWNYVYVLKLLVESRSTLWPANVILGKLITCPHFGGL